METNTNDPVIATAATQQRRSGLRTWMIALALGATLAVGGAASVFAASPSADPSASPAATSSEDTGGTTEDTTGDRQCPESDADSGETDASSS